MRNLRKITALAALIALSTLLSACGDSGIEVTSRFGQSQYIKEGVAVFFKGELAGEVTDIDEDDNGSSIVTMRIDPESAELISKQAAIVVNNFKTGTPLEIHNSANPKALGLENGDQLNGLDSMMNLIGWSVGDALDFGGSELSGYLKSFQEYLESDQFQDDKASVQSQVKNFTDEAAAAIKGVDDEILATINGQELSEEELARAMDQLGDELAPVIEDIASSGAKIVQELERFAEGLEAHNEEQQDTGVKFLDSLSTMLEKLNQSMEKGLEKGAVDQEKN